MSEAPPLEHEIVCGRHGKVMGILAWDKNGQGYVCRECFKSFGEMVHRKLEKAAALLKKKGVLKE